MYVTTFYSFKGGVGRTLALSNVAAKLAGCGKTVVVVDFDLEAPGLDSYFTNPNGNGIDTRGLYGFVTDYIDSGTSIELTKEHYYEWSSKKIQGNCWGKLYVVPAGSSSTRGDNNIIDWKRLYEEQNGYHLFEHFRKQLDDKLKPDYVFIDSRTGFTDVCGICTRQLPDSVVLLYTLDEQNLAGIKEIKSGIVEEQENYKELDINRLTDIIQVESNIPNLDDEDHILSELRDKANNTIPWEEDIIGNGDPLLIQRYQSLQLLKTPLFSLVRKNSRISKEFDALRIRIISNNFIDEDVIFQKARNYFESLINIRRLSSINREWMDIFFIPSRRSEYLHDSSFNSNILFGDISEQISTSVKKHHYDNPDLLICAVQVLIAKLFDDEDREIKRRPSFLGKMSKKGRRNAEAHGFVDISEQEKIKIGKEGNWDKPITFLSKALECDESHSQANLILSLLKIKYPEIVKEFSNNFPVLNSTDTWDFALKVTDDQWLNALNALLLCKTDWLGENYTRPSDTSVDTFLRAFDRIKIWSKEPSASNSFRRNRTNFSTIERICSLSFINKNWASSASKLIITQARILKPVVKSRLNREPSRVGASDIVLTLTSNKKFKTVLFLLGYNEQITDEVVASRDETGRVITPPSFRECDFDWVQSPSENSNWPYSTDGYQNWTEIDSVPYLYNLGIASWGAFGEPPKKLFNRLLELGYEDGAFEEEWNSKENLSESVTINTSNFWQCIAFAESAAGKCPRESLCRSLASINIMAGQLERCNEYGLLDYLSLRSSEEQTPESLLNIWVELMKIYDEFVDETYFGLLNSSILQRVDSDSFVENLNEMWKSVDSGLVPEMIKQS